MSPSDTTRDADAFLPHLRDVVRCEAALRELNLAWRMVESGARLDCPPQARGLLPMLRTTREGFERLEHELIASLVHERTADVVAALGTLAEQIADVVVRNLYERTADVGFLATDRELCDHLSGRRPDRAAATARLRAYRDKYTVYDDILLLDTQGRVLAQTDTAAPVQASRDPLVAQTLARDGHVETFRATDLRPQRRHALIYSRRMHAADGRVAGVLCLSFAFDDELAGLFHARRGARQGALMLLLDGEDRVIASADPLWVPVGAHVPVHHGATAQPLLFAGREYLVQTRRPRAYQGYPGPAGWQGQVMVPLDVAFGGTRRRTREGLAPALAAGLLTHARRFCPPLHAITEAAQAIRRVVWNGQVMAAGQRRVLPRLTAILEQVGETGARTDALFAQSIGELYDTVLGASLQRGEFAARLLVDLLERNLYERCADCRWWALAPGLRQALAQPGAAVPEGLLQGIHALYTVYTRLVVYDAEGLIVAESRRPGGGADAAAIGRRIDAATLAAVHALPTPQHHHAAPFGPSALYGDRATFVFHAAIRHPQDERVVGGIGIVLDADGELPAMLRAALREDRPGTAALFVDRHGAVLAGTDPALPTGSRLALPEALQRLPHGGAAACIAVHQGQYAVMAAAAGAGYREYRPGPGVDHHDVLAVVVEPLGEQRQAVPAGDAPVPGHAGDAPVPDQATGGGEPFATFVVDGQLHALPARCVLQALPAAHIAPVAAARAPWRLGLVALDGGAAPRHAWAYDLAGLLRGRPTAAADGLQVIVMRPHGTGGTGGTGGAGGADGVTGVNGADGAVGLLVQALHGVPEFHPGQVMALPATGGPSPVSHLLRASARLIPVLNPAALAALVGPAALAAQPAEPEVPA